MSEESPDDSRERLVAQAATLLDIHDHISYIIRDLNLPTDHFEDQYDVKTDDTYEFEPMVRLYLYRKIAGLSQEDATDNVANWTYLQQRFGFDTVPRQQTLSHTERERFSLKFRIFLKDVADDIRDLAADSGIRESQLATPDTNPSPNEITEDIPLHHYVDKQAPGLISDTIDLVFPMFDTGRAHNVTHEDHTVFEHQLLMSLADRAGTRSAYRTFNKFRHNALHHDTHVRAVKQLGAPAAYQATLTDFQDSNSPRPEWRQITDTITPQFAAAVDNILNQVRNSDTFTEPVVAAIDTVRVPFHVSPWKDEEDIKPGEEEIVVDKDTGKARVPKEEYPEMVNGRKGDGRAYEYATLTIIARNVPIVIAVEPIRHASTWEGDDGETVSWAETVDRLMEQATDLLDIHLVMADKEFQRHGVMHVLDQYYDVDYLMPKRENSEAVKESLRVVRYDPTLKSMVKPAELRLRNETPYIDIEADDTVGENNKSHELNLMYVPAEREDWIHEKAGNTKYTGFVTNREDVSALDALGFTERYGNRWDIENEYKMIQPLMPSIASTDYRMRYFSFVFSCLLYNMWRLTDHSLKQLLTEAYDDYGREAFDERLPTVIPMADFLATSLILMFNPDGLDPPLDAL